MRTQLRLVSPVLQCRAQRARYGKRGFRTWRGRLCRCGRCLLSRSTSRARRMLIEARGDIVACCRHFSLDPHCLARARLAVSQSAHSSCADHLSVGIILVPVTRLYVAIFPLFLSRSLFFGVPKKLEPRLFNSRADPKFFLPSSRKQRSAAHIIYLRRQQPRLIVIRPPPFVCPSCPLQSRMQAVERTANQAASRKRRK